MEKQEKKNIIDETLINDILQKSEQKKLTKTELKKILAKAAQCKGLTLKEVASLISVKDKGFLEEIFTTAKKIKEDIYGNRLVLFAPLYVSNVCGNKCLYCAFRSDNKELKRRTLTQEEIAHETNLITGSGQKRILLVAGENYAPESIDYILESIGTVYATKKGRGEIRRLNVNIAPLDVDDFRRLKNAEIGTYQIFQETYHRETYSKMHIYGRKSDYDWRIFAMDRAMEAGIDDVGIGALFGLYDWRFELLALLQHAEHLEEVFGVGPHTISVPRLEPALGSDVASQPPYKLNDEDFCKLVAILRLAVPYTGIIMSTRENAEMRRATFELGVSQISAGSKTDPGGYSKSNKDVATQFSLGDHRSLDEVVQDVASLGYIPSFCTACYRVGRVGANFMALSKTGKIKNMCGPNALLTFYEYLLDYASAETNKAGLALIEKEIAKMSETQRDFVLKSIEKLKSGQRDLFV